jgi:hypothetical protein
MEKMKKVKTYQDIVQVRESAHLEIPEVDGSRRYYAETQNFGIILATTLSLQAG